jgi:hypothetical protein
MPLFLCLEFYVLLQCLAYSSSSMQAIPMSEEMAERLVKT